MGPLGQMPLLLFPSIPLLLKLLILNSQLVVPPGEETGAYEVTIGGFGSVSQSGNETSTTGAYFVAATYAAAFFARFVSAYDSLASRFAAEAFTG